MSDTPETDKNTWSDSSEGILYKVVTSDFARKLERERDKARTELEMWRDGNIMHQIHRDELEKTERERDEARNELKQWHTLRLYGAEPEYIHEYIRMLRYNC
jgi:uncharacterized protein YaaW (UPF0174 family)